MPTTPSLSDLWEVEGFQAWSMGLVFLSPLAYGSVEAGMPWFVAFPLLFCVLVVAPMVRFVRRTMHSLPDSAPSTRRSRAARVVLLTPITLLLWFLERLAESQWIRELHRDGLHDEVARAVEDLLGDDRGTLLVTSSHTGLRAPRESAYFVSNSSAVDLRRKMAQLEGGTIAVSGPRGVGKTTLMEHAVEPRDFSVFAHAPATYAPHDFLTSLFVSVCQQYIMRAGYDPPEFVRLSYFPRALRSVLRPLRMLLRWLAFMLPAAALVALGLFSTERSFEREHGPLVRQHLTATLDGLAAFVDNVTDGKAPAAALALVLTGMMLWTLRTSHLFAGLLRTICKQAVRFGAFALTVGPVLSLYFDPDYRRHMSSSESGRVWVFSLLLLWYLCWSRYRRSSQDAVVSIGRWSVSRKEFYGLLSKLLPFGVLALAVTTESLRPLLTDSENPIRICVFLLGLLLQALRRRPWSFLRPTPKLVVACRNHLYRLQTVQSSTAALTTSGTRLLTLGTSHTSALTSVPPNYPALVSEFRALLTLIGRAERGWGNRVVIAIDEIDRLGTDMQALAFLAEIKAILGVPHVHYLISVAEDVGAAFVRRGLPNRDVTDSSLDDVLHVRRCTLDESAAILTKRAPGIGNAYIALAHALSGGIPRDLIRYGRRLVDIRTTAELVELPDVARTLIMEELSETLAGFRTLLAKQQWGPETHSVLGSFSNLAAHLRGACPCPERTELLRRTIAIFVSHAVDELPDEPRSLIDEASAYAYLSLTLLDIFGRPTFNRRLAQAAQEANGDPDLLAEARQELSVSPYSTRPVIDDIRRAWGLDPVSRRAAHQTVTIPPPRGPACTGIHRAL
jgi:hypothetical protein